MSYALPFKPVILFHLGITRHWYIQLIQVISTFFYNYSTRLSCCATGMSCELHRILILKPWNFMCYLDMLCCHRNAKYQNNMWNSWHWMLCWFSLALWCGRQKWKMLMWGGKFSDHKLCQLAPFLRWKKIILHHCTYGRLLKNSFLFIILSVWINKPNLYSKGTIILTFAYLSMLHSVKWYRSHRKLYNIYEYANSSNDGARAVGLGLFDGGADNEPNGVGFTDV